MDFFFYNTDDRALKAPPIPRYPVLLEKGFAATGGSFEKYGTQFRQLKPGDILLMYRNEFGLVAVGQVQGKWDEKPHTEPVYYRPEEMGGLDGGPSEYRIPVEWFLSLDLPIPAATLRKRIGFTSPKAVQKIGKSKAKAERLVAELRAAHMLLPEEISRPDLYTEGAVTQRWVNTYERDPAARRACIKEYGVKCAICQFDFGKVFGSELAGFIHVHHLIPLSAVKKEYKVNPETDLIPVCPNCHAVIHYGGQLRTPDDVKELLKKSAKSEGS